MTHRSANKITGANAGGPRLLLIRSLWVARIAQLPLGEYSMNTTRLLIAFVAYSLLLLVGYRPLTRPEGVRFWQSTTPVETTTAEERSRGESSFTIRKERRFGIAKNGFFLTATLGYIALFIGFAIAFFVASRSAHP
jgi:hypothetical protein